MNRGVSRPALRPPEQGVRRPDPAATERDQLAAALAPDQVEEAERLADAFLAVKSSDLR